MKWLFGSIFGWLGVICLGVSCPMLIGAGLLYYGVTAAVKDWVLVQGTVTDLYTQGSFDAETGISTTYYCISVAYTTVGGQALEADLNECATPPAYSPGDAVQIYYNPQNPQDAQLKGGVEETMYMMFVALLGVIGGLAFLAGLALCAFGAAGVIRRSKTPNSS